MSSSGPGGARELRRDNHAVYVRHHPALEVAAAAALARAPATAPSARPRHPLVPERGLGAAARPGQPPGDSGPAQRHHRVDVGVPEPREQERRRRQQRRGAARQPDALPRRRRRRRGGGGARRPGAGAQAGHLEAPRRRAAQALVVPPRPVRLDAVARLRHEAGHVPRWCRSDGHDGMWCRGERRVGVKHAAGALAGGWFI